MEAFVSGLPVVALNCRGVSDMLGKDNGYIVNNLEEFMDAVEELKNDKKLRDKISKNNK